MWDPKAGIPESNAGMGVHRNPSQGSSFVGLGHETGWNDRIPAQAGVWFLCSWWSDMGVP